jgi:hypothetical protein
VQAFCSALRDAGFGRPDRFGEVGSEEESPGDGNSFYWAFTVVPATREALASADRMASEIAHTHGVRYDRWTVQRDVSGGRRRSVEAVMGD